jgi:acetamidase/formamidase
MRTYALPCAALALLGAAAAAEAAPKTHRLEPSPTTVAYGHYWSETPPVLRIASGDFLDVDTVMGGNPERLARAGVPDAKIPAPMKAIVSQLTGDRKGPGGHMLTGPVYIDGAEPGDVLEVKILSIELTTEFGTNACKGLLPENCEKDLPNKVLWYDRQRKTTQFEPGIVVPLRPFFGSMGVAPAPALGRVSSGPPGRHAGNLDNRALVAGSTLYIPIFVRGALFQIGDGHAAQGDGEVDGTAVETSLRGRLQLTVRKDMKLAWPRAETATDYISMAAEPDLMAATKTAIQEMIDFLVATRGLTRHRAYQLVSIAGNVAITQIVDLPNYGVHVKLPKSIFTSAPAAAPAPRPASASSPAPARPAAPAAAPPAAPPASPRK